MKQNNDNICIENSEESVNFHLILNSFILRLNMFLFPYLDKKFDFPVHSAIVASL